MNKKTSIIVTFGLLVGIGILFFGGSIFGGVSDGEQVENSTVKDGIQYVTVNAGGGYFPKISSAKAGIPTKLVVKTDGVYDCSSSLVVKSVGFREILPQTGETEIDIGVPEAGESLSGTCSMGMYNFSVNFN